MPQELESTAIMRINERRQMLVLADLADEHEPISPEHGGGVVAFKHGVRWLCGAIGCGIDTPLTPEGARHVVEYVASRGGRPRIDLTDQSGADAYRAAADAGLVLDETERVLARSLAEPVEMPEVDGLTLENLDPENETQLQSHAEHTTRGFAPAGTEPSAGEFEATIRSLTHPRSRGFLAFVNGQLAGTCGMEVITVEPSAGVGPVRVASLWGAVVGEGFRRRGIQQALIAQRLLQGQAEGCSAALIECKPGIPTERNAGRLGFSLAYTRLAFKAPVAGLGP